ncbi:DNA-3-methyladenine glycosylase 2 family protein [Halomonas piscis]|uniref:DNA-3-methyladenine glycosylase II n=1 Tax=Halomonas piscis TaxID=3031727 RepID=A0ABY9Z2C0_9GAMM|nr:DNA-3-methyladenine glycosylase 2 family protein [Halomonas piscis]WNK20353.1 DNA-3-methyladenine glycosylase 2 family protein [Halomonas piscis]
MPHRDLEPGDLEHALQALTGQDTDIARALPQVGVPELRRRDKGFATLLGTIVSQQISLEAARAISGRLKERLPALSARAIVAADGQTLRDAGLSWRKVEYAQGLAEAELSGTFNAAALETMSDADAVAAITALRGFGRWSAEIYLMFSLARDDIFPADDLALRAALGKLKRLDERPTPGQSRRLVEHWAPHRSAGALFLWHYYRNTPRDTPV